MKGHGTVPTQSCGARAGRAPFAQAANPQRGVAMLIVLTWLALMISVVSEFTYGTSVDSSQAANARDEVRAHYLALSAVNLSRLLIKIQQRFVEPVMGQAQKMLQQAMGGATAPPAPRAAPRPAASAARALACG